MSQARTQAAATLVLAALAIGGCGPLGGKSDSEQVSDAVNNLIEARNQGDYATVCDLIAEQQLVKFKAAGTTCAEALPKIAQKGSTTTIRIEQVRVSGDRATVDATVSHNAGAGRAQTILLVKEGGDWKVAKVGF
jgi:ketosteroid isomerase-like protein